MDAHDTPDRAKFVVGLGNPGTKYAGTRHNVGFRVLEIVRDRWRPGAGREAFDGRLYDARPSRGGESRRVMLLAPQTYMNASGRAVRRLADFYKAEPADVLIVMDDLALPLAALRLRPSGSAGGHNGLADILRAMGTDQVPRLRIGIGAKPPGWDQADYVLSRFRPDEREEIDVAIRLAADAVEDWVFDGMDAAMEKHNRRRTDD